MVYQYKFVGHNYEGSKTTVLCHVRQFTEQEFHDVVMAATPLALEKKAARSPLHNGAHSLEDLHDDIVEVLCERYGFHEANYSVEFYFSNWRTLDGRSFRDDVGSKCEDMARAIVEAGFTEEFFAEWWEFRTPYHDEPYYNDPDHEAGLAAGLAFRLNEILGRRFFRNVTLPVYEDS